MFYFIICFIIPSLFILLYNYYTLCYIKYNYKLLILLFNIITIINYS